MRIGGGVCQGQIPEGYNWFDRLSEDCRPSLDATLKGLPEGLPKGTPQEKKKAKPQFTCSLRCPFRVCQGQIPEGYAV